MEKVNVNGIQLAYARRGKGTPLVLLHGYPLDHHLWDEVVPLLEDTFDVILPDLRGFGEVHNRRFTLSPWTIMLQTSRACSITSASKKLQSLDIPWVDMLPWLLPGSIPTVSVGLGLVSSQVLADPS